MVVRISLGLVLLATTSAFGQISCPDSVTVDQRLSSPMPGWKAGLDALPHRLATITFFDGPPEEQASLVNDKTVRSGVHETAIWLFSAIGERPTWMVCGYAGTSVTLAKGLAETKGCSIRYNMRQRVAGMPLIEGLKCR